MNRDRLKVIFNNYINKFEFVNNKENDENYKWRVAYQFHDLMDPAHPDFPERIKEAHHLSKNLIDGRSRYCFSALVNCASKEPEAVRSLFAALFADDGNDLVLRQQKISKFIEDANLLTARLISANTMFMNDQRSAMGYLFFNDPNNNYLYKYSEATDFASCIEFYDDWGPSTNFHLDIYYHMCDLVVEEIKDNDSLLDTHRSRYKGKNDAPVEGMHPDSNYHILLFDIIYGAPEFRYNFYEGISFPPITAQARTLYQEQVKKHKKIWKFF